MGWGSGDIYLCLLLKKLCGTLHLAMYFIMYLISCILIRKNPPHNAQAIMSNIQLHSGGARTFIFLLLLGYKVTVWKFLPAYKGLEEALWRNE